MTKRLFLWLLAGVLLLTHVLPASAGRVRGRIWIGPGWGTEWHFRPYYYPYSYYYVPPIIVEPPELYYYPAPLPQTIPPQQPAPQYYWYYCQDPKGYYPYVNECPSGWQKVVPSPPPAQGKE